MKKKKFKRKYIVPSVLLAVLIISAVLFFWQEDNISALMDYSNYTREELEEQLQQNDQAIKDAVNAVPEITIRDVTDEEREALKDGTLTQEELIDQLLTKEETTPELPEEPPQDTPSGSSPDTDHEKTDNPETLPEKEPAPAPEQSDYERRLSELVAQVYVLREEYLIKLDALLAEAKEVYKSTPAEQRTGSWIADAVSSYLAKGTSLEKECDRRMDSIVTELSELIKDNNGDMSLVDTVIETYANEKRLKKAWYMSRLEEKGLI